MANRNFTYYCQYFDKMLKCSFSSCIELRLNFLLVARYFLLIIFCSLLVTFCALLFARCSLLSARCSLLFAHYFLLVAHYFLLVTFYSLLVTFCSLLVTFCSLLFACCSLIFRPNYCEIKLLWTAKKWFDYNKTPPQIFSLQVSEIFVNFSGWWISKFSQHAKPFSKLT